MKKEVYFGYKVYDDNGNLIGYEPNNTGEGFVYKDTEAFENNTGEICYISEHAFPEDNPFFISVEEAKKAGETHDTIAQQVRDAFGEDYMLTDEQVEYFAQDVFEIAEWACIATYLAENFEIEDCIDFDGAKNGGVFTQFQIEAVMNGMTPKEYADRELSYQEYSEFCDEFYRAFVVDDECIDDCSEAGLGTNALITYVDDRRRGEVSGTDDFAEKYGVKEEWRKFIGK